MNTKQLAEFLGKNYRVVERHAKKIGIIFDHGIEKIYTKNECLMIAESFYKTIPQPIRSAIDELSTKIQSELSTKVQSEILKNVDVKNNLDKNVEVKPNNIAVLESLEIVIKTLKDQENRLYKIEQKTNNLIEYDNNYMKLKAFCSKNKIYMNRSEMIKVSKELKKLSLANKKEIKKVQDDNFGEVNAYHVDILHLYFFDGAKICVI